MLSDGYIPGCRGVPLAGWKGLVWLCGSSAGYLEGRGEGRSEGREEEFLVFENEVEGEIRRGMKVEREEEEEEEEEEGGDKDMEKEEEEEEAVPTWEESVRLTWAGCMRRRGQGQPLPPYPPPVWGPAE